MKSTNIYDNLHCDWCMCCPAVHCPTICHCIDALMYERAHRAVHMYEWMHKSMYESMHECMNKCMHEWADEWMHQWMNAWMNQSINAWMNARRSDNNGCGKLEASCVLDKCARNESLVAACISHLYYQCWLNRMPKYYQSCIDWIVAAQSRIM